MIQNFDNGGSVTFEVTTSVPRTSWKERPHFYQNKAYVPTGGQIQIEYPEAGEVAMRFTITGGARTYLPGGELSGTTYSRRIILDRETLPSVSGTYKIKFQANAFSEVELIEV